MGGVCERGSWVSSNLLVASMSPQDLEPQHPQGSDSPDDRVDSADEEQEGLLQAAFRELVQGPPHVRHLEGWRRGRRCNMS